MDTLPCGHAAEPGDRRLCPHLAGRFEDFHRPDHYRLLTGRGLAWDACCKECEALPDRVLLPVCRECADDIASDESCQLGYVGRPEIRDRPDPVDARFVQISLPAELKGAIDLAPLPDPDTWLVLLPAAPSQSTNPDRGTDRFLTLAVWTAGSAGRLVADVALPAETGPESFGRRSRRLRLRASADGRFAVVGTDHGRHGAVVDLADGRTTLRLDQGAYRPDTVPFVAAFTVHDGRTVLIHRTIWNRLDASDAATGELLTARELPRLEAKAPFPPHYLDYFHGELAVSPDGRWIADNGWNWGPYANASAWRLDAWLSGNVWESEDGPSRRRVAGRWDWLTPVCWLDDRHVALGGYEGGYHNFLDGVRIVDVETGDDGRSFGGPRGDHFFRDGDRLYAADGTGLEVWDFATGERTAVWPGFSPTHHHPASRVLAQLDGERLLTLRIVRG